MKKTVPIRALAALTVLGSVTCGPRRGGSSGPLPAGAVRVDRIVAVVDARPITCSEVELESRINLASEGRCADALRTLAPGDMAEMLQALIDRSLILREWGHEETVAVAEERLDEEIATIRRACVTDEGYQRLLEEVELTEQEVRLRRQRTLRAEALLLERFGRVWQLQRSRIQEEDLPPGDRQSLEDREKQRILNEILDRLRQPARRVRIVDDLHGVSSCQAAS